MVGVLAYKLKDGRLARHTSRLPHVGKARSRNPEQACRSANGLGIASLRFPWHTVKVVAHSQVQREIRTNFPIVFEECSPFVLMKFLEPVLRFEDRFLCAFYVESIREAGAG